MFTGLVEEIGAVKSILPKAGCSRLTVKALTVTEGTKPGDSISVDGVCLTAVEAGKDGLSFDIMPETLQNTALRSLRAGSSVNLERAARADSRIGGHMVSGHIDCIGIVRSRKIFRGQLTLTISIKPSFLKSVYRKGSVAIDGVSLTVAEKKGGCFSVCLIPHTAKATTLGKKTAGNTVNIETDMMAKMALNSGKEWKADD